ncbi:MAG: hypothetical protein P1U78_09095 [Alcanivoracaceae bacterium]|nr:hypothetical protein [Alcanivoracaceae bacterium]
MFADASEGELAAVSTPASLQPMSDSELQDVQGQALFVSNKIDGNGSIATGTNGISFYRAGLDATLALNANIKNLELGRTGPGNQVDLWAENMAFGCTADAGGNCVSSASATQLKSFLLERPYFEFAIRNDTSTTLREVIGVRLGAESAEGPLSIGNFRVFSGYLTARANIILQAQGTNNTNDIAITCGPSTGPCPGSLGGTGRNAFGLNEPLRSLGLDNDQACLVICAQFKDITVGFGQVSRNNLPVVASGKRQTQGFISGANFNSAVNELTGTLNVIRSDGLPAGLINLIFGLIEGQARDKIKNQLYTNLGLASVGGAWNNTGAQQAILENYAIPYNVSNLHQVDVNSPLFGLSFQNQAVRFPGYAQNVPVGWGFYLPDAFTLTVAEPTTIFVSNIANGQAAAGNIIGLDPVYDNCWGAAQFC